MSDWTTHAKQFRQDGFVKVEGFLSPDELTTVRAEVERYKRDVVPTLASFRALYEKGDDAVDLKMLTDMDKADSFFADLIHGEKAKSLASALLGDEAIVRGVEYFDKPPKIGTPTPAHQDGFYFCLDPNEAVTMWIALDAADEGNACLHYVRGSHLRGLIDHAGSGVVGFSQGMTEKKWSAEDDVAACALAGDCLAHHSLTVHFTHANGSDRHRRSLGLVYHAARTKPDEAALARYEASVNAQRENYYQGATN
jgi:phytanoyl-CoA hydroxylase